MDENKSNITYLGSYTGDASKISVIDMLRDCIEDMKSGVRGGCKKAIVIFLEDTEDGQYDTGFSQAGMKMSEIVSLLSVIKHDVLDMLTSDYE
jgi:hypothetical protein